MFNKTVVVNHETEHVPYVKTVVEKKAPTDESIRLLNEFQDKAELNVVRRISLDDNSVKGMGVFWMKSQESFSDMATVRFILNGIEYVVKVEISEVKTKIAQNQELAHILYEHLANAVSTELFKEFTKEFIKTKNT
jgi:hypothetical protein